MSTARDIIANVVFDWVMAEPKERETDWLGIAGAVMDALAASGRVVGTPLFGAPIETDALGASIALVRVDES